MIAPTKQLLDFFIDSFADVFVRIDIADDACKVTSYHSISSYHAIQMIINV